MPIQKLTSTNAFVAIDLDGAPAAGIVRCAPKILQGGAKDLARSLTYSFATFEMKRSGASAGINASADERADAISSFVEELTPTVAGGDLSLGPAKGVTAADLAPLTDADDRNTVANTVHEADDLATHLAGLGAIVAAEHSLGGLDGKRIAIEGFASAGAALADAAVARGARVVAVSTTKGTRANDDGLDTAELRNLWDEESAAMVGEDADPAWKVFGLEADVLFAGSKMGAINHETAGKLGASLVVPHGPIPFTARALAVMSSNDVTAIPDFISTAGPLFAWWPEGDEEPSAIVTAASDAIISVLDDTTSHGDGGFLGACYRAEAFLSTWQESLPFGRPLAS